MATRAQLAHKLRQRRIYKRFLISYLLIFFIFVWGFTDYAVPVVSDARLSAKPAPPLPHLEDAWVSLIGMHRASTVHELSRGDSLAVLFKRNNIPVIAADAALDALDGFFDSRRLQPGQKVRIFWESPRRFSTQGDISSFRRFAGFDLIPDPRRRLIVRRLKHLEFATTKLDRILSDHYFLAEGLITNSFYEAARSAGLSPGLVFKLIQLFSFSVDFQRSVREGDTLEVLYTRRFDNHNQLAAEGRILYAALTNRGERHAFWAITPDDAPTAYFDEQGRSIRRLLMRTPVDGARLSSRFGLRRHPVLGYSRLHKGIDFAAPVGTPVYAAGDGIVVDIGAAGSYGKRIRLRHSNSFETLYAHLHNFKIGLKRGDRVHQGQIIAYVGNTGRSTGAHLHYEILRNGDALNPEKIDLPAGKKLDTQGIVRLNEQRKIVRQHIATIAASKQKRFVRTAFNAAYTNGDSER